MLFLSYGFAGGQYSLDTTPSYSGKVKSFVLMNGAWDEFFVSKDINLTEIPVDWNVDTVLHAHFTRNLYIGSVDFGVEETESIRVKRRLKDTFNWITVYEQMTNSIEDFNFIFLDYTARSKTEYDYCLVPVIGGVEGVPIISKIKTCFVGLIISEKDKCFAAQLETDVNPQQQNSPRAVVNTMHRVHPFIVHNGDNNYTSGTVSAIFAEYNEKTNEWDIKNSWKYRERLNKFLYNKIPKLLKYEDGRMKLIGVSSDSITESEVKNNKLLVKTSVGWTEIDDCDDGEALYDNGLIDYNYSCFS